MSISIRLNVPNTATVTIGSVDLHFSYATLIGYRDSYDGLVVHVNDWSATTGKHLNLLDGGSVEARGRRVLSPEFDAKVAIMLKRHGLDKY